MKLLINILAAGALAFPASLVLAEHHEGHKEGKAGHGSDCCDQKDCCKDCDSSSREGDHKDGKHSCCDDKSKAKECCKDCKDKKCQKACKTGTCKKGHCDLKKPKETKPAQSTPEGT
jgi:hypothetical protein